MPKKLSWKPRIARSINAIDSRQWDACANPAVANPDCTITYDPFISHAFLSALEKSRSAVAATGWAPYHLVVEDDDNVVYGAAPMYLKSHSLGEYVFDWGWADAYERTGGKYYPKLQISIPFTPVVGRRLLTRHGKYQLEIEKCLLSASIQVAERLKLSSLHITFPAQEQWERMREMGFLQRIDQQFHWLNEEYDSFDGFLGTLSSKKRKNIKRERRAAAENSIEIEHLTGRSITEEHWDDFFSFYIDTGSRKWGTPYLTRSFFRIIGETMADNILLIMCKRNGRYMAGALNFIGGDCLYGRYWGCLEDHAFLHFEVCYYQAIEFAIENNLKRVEAGAQGDHKLARGYLPKQTYSAHWIAEKGFQRAVEDYLISERRLVGDDIDHLSGHSPFRKDQ